MIRFGTGGWREIIGDGFTRANVRLLVQGLCDRMRDEGVAERGVVVGYDRRFLSDVAAWWAASASVTSASASRPPSVKILMPL